MKFILREKNGRLVESSRSTRPHHSSVVGIIFDHEREFNDFNWNVCTFKSTLETIKIANHEDGFSVKQISNTEITGFTKLREIDFGKSKIEEGKQILSSFLHAFSEAKPKMMIDDCLFDSNKDRQNQIEYLMLMNRYQAPLATENSDNDEFEETDTVMVKLGKKPSNIDSKTGRRLSFLADPNPTYRAVTSGNAAKVEQEISALKISKNAKLESLKIQNANLIGLDISGIKLPKLENLDLEGCEISWPVLKKLVEVSPNLKTINVNHLTIQDYDQSKLKTSFPKLELKGSPQFAPSRSGASASKKAESSSSSISAVTPTSTSKKVESSLLMNDVLKLYEDNLKTRIPFSEIKVETEADSDIAVLIHDREKLMQTTGREVQAFSKLTNSKSGIELEVQAKMILKGLGVAVVEVDDIDASTELPKLEELKFGEKNNNPDLENAIKTLLQELHNAKDNASHYRP